MKNGILVSKDNWPADPDVLEIWTKDGLYPIHDRRLLHRTDGPAIVRFNWRCKWFVNGESYIDNRTFQKAAKLSNQEMTIIILKYGDIS